MLVSSQFLASWQRALLGDLQRFAPELIVSATILLVLFLRMFRGSSKLHLGSIALGGSVAALLTLLGPVFGLWPSSTSGPAFSGLLILDNSAHYLRTLIILATVLLIVLTRITQFPELEDDADFYTLLLGSTLGLMLMVSASHMAIVFLALEMASLPSYALAGFWKSRRSGEAALKYVLFGAASAGAALYGISLIVVQCGTGSLPELAQLLSQSISTGAGIPPLVWAGLVLICIGLGFKLAAVPFHFWLPDVFSGATAEVGAFLSVASKIAAVGLIARIFLTLQSSIQTLDPVYLPKQFASNLVIVAILTMTLGNLAALAQTHFKRLLAYSTIAHAGYLLLGLATLQNASAVYFYLAAYLLMNLGAFATVALLRSSNSSDEISTYQGLLYRSPSVAICLGLFLLSLLGLPPLAGFVGKFQLFASVYEAGRTYSQAGQQSLGWMFHIGLGFALFNTLLSAGYYLKVLKIIGLDEPVADAPTIQVPTSGKLYLMVLAAGLIVLGLWWEPLAQYLVRTL
jgi:NADH-quinone oxidoreductase subunit N